MQKTKYAVIFTSLLDQKDPAYDLAAEKMLQMVSNMPGYISSDSLRGADGKGITISDWESYEAIHAWGKNQAHQAVQNKGRAWYSTYEIKYACIEEERSWPKK